MERSLLKGPSTPSNERTGLQPLCACVFSFLFFGGGDGPVGCWVRNRARARIWGGTHPERAKRQDLTSSTARFVCPAHRAAGLEPRRVKEATLSSSSGKFPHRTWDANYAGRGRRRKGVRLAFKKRIVCVPRQLPRVAVKPFPLRVLAESRRSLGHAPRTRAYRR